MAGGGGKNLLESPVWLAALVFLVFLLISLFIEVVVHRIKHIAQKRGRRGLIMAISNIEREVLLLGCLSLLLTILTDALTSRCVGHYGYGWSIVQHVESCAPCLRGSATEWYIKDFHCEEKDAEKHRRLLGHDEWDSDLLDGFSSQELDAAARVSEHLYQTQAAGTGRQLLAASGGGDCPEGEEPLISATTLHQVHILLFCYALLHILVSAICGTLAHVRLSGWQNVRESTTLTPLQPFMDGAARPGMTPEVQPAVFASDVAAVDKALSAPSEIAVMVNHAPSRIGSSARESKSGLLGGAYNSAVKWLGRDKYQLDTWKEAIKELAICYYKQFVLPLSGREFQLLRASFMATYHLPDTFNFTTYIQASLDHDFAHIVGVTPAMWLLCMFCLIIAGAVGWYDLTLVALATVLTQVVNTRLIWVARAITAGGEVRQLGQDLLWLHRIPIRALAGDWLRSLLALILFLCAFVYANALFMVWQLGGSDFCYFRLDSDLRRRSSVTIPWFVALAANTALLFFISFVTLPLYSFVSQCGSRVKMHLLVSGETSNQMTDALGRARQRIMTGAIPADEVAEPPKH